jgi:hypothetical protein
LRHSVVATAALDDVAPTHVVPDLLRGHEHTVHIEHDRLDHEAGIIGRVQSAALLRSAERVAGQQRP